MRQLRFYIPFKLQPGDSYQIPDDKARHIVQVLRLGVGDEFILFNGDGKEYSAKLTEATKKNARVTILAVETVNRESNLQVHLIQGLSKGDRMDATIQKCVELGVNLIYPISTCYSNVKINVSRMEKKHAHWGGVISSACEQSGRNVIPQLKASNQFESAVSEYTTYSGKKFILHPAAGKNLSQLNEKPQNLVLLVGPEGGFSDEELQYAEKNGFQHLSLGPRVLRTETAAMAVMAGIQAKWGDI